MKRLVVLISGSGSNLQAIIDAIEGGTLDAEIACVVSNRRAAFGLERARRAGIPTLYFPLGIYRRRGLERTQYDADLAALIQESAPNLIVLAGWMLVLSSAFLERFPRRVINLHPALPGEFPGTHAIERAHAAAQQGEITRTGVMVHYAVPEVDAGPVIRSQEVPIAPHDTLEVLTERIHATEHQILVEAISHALVEPAATP